MRDDFLWVEKYRPRTIDECILPESTKNTFKEFLKSGQIPNMLLHGTAGIGKTTVAMALCEELGCSYIKLNGSDEGRQLDTVRNKIKNFASTVSLYDDAKHKVIIIDKLTTQPAMYNSLYGQALRNFMVTAGLFSPVTTSRKSSNQSTVDVVVDFSIKGNDKKLLASKFFNRLGTILETEGVQYDEKVLPQVIIKFFLTGVEL